MVVAVKIGSGDSPGRIKSINCFCERTLRFLASKQVKRNSDDTVTAAAGVCFYNAMRDAIFILG